MASLFNVNTTTSRSMIVIGSSVVAFSSLYWLSYPFVSKYGWVGLLRYVWQGDPYSENVRESVDVLDEVEHSLPSHESRIEQLEVSLERAKLNTVDGGSGPESTTSSSSSDSQVVRPVWIALHAPRDLRKDLAQINSDLDKLAADVDRVLTYDELHVKLRKKATSQTVVELMDRVDVLLKSYGIDDSARITR